MIPSWLGAFQEILSVVQALAHVCSPLHAISQLVSRLRSMISPWLWLCTGRPQSRSPQLQAESSKIARMQEPKELCKIRGNQSKIKRATGTETNQQQERTGVGQTHSATSTFERKKTGTTQCMSWSRARIPRWKSSKSQIYAFLLINIRILSSPLIPPPFLPKCPIFSR
eukprot:755086-Hanusia_phi.AAC.7